MKIIQIIASAAALLFAWFIVTCPCDRVGACHLWQIYTSAAVAIGAVVLENI